VFDGVDHRAPQMISRRVLRRTQRFGRSNPSGDPVCSIKKGVDVQMTAASKLQVPLMESIGLMANPCVTAIRIGSGTGLIHGMAESDVSYSS